MQHGYGTGGYTCQKCGQYVLYGVTHACTNTYPQQLIGVGWLEPPEVKIGKLEKRVADLEDEVRALKRKI